MMLTSVGVLEIGLVLETHFLKGVGLVSGSTAFVLGLVLVSDL